MLKSKIELTVGEYTYVYDANDTSTLCVYKDSSYPVLTFNPLCFRVNGKCMAPWGEDITLEQLKEIVHNLSEFIPNLESMIPTENENEEIDTKKEGN